MTTFQKILAIIGTFLTAITVFSTLYFNLLKSKSSPPIDDNTIVIEQRIIGASSGRISKTITIDREDMKHEKPSHNTNHQRTGTN